MHSIINWAHCALIFHQWGVTWRPKVHAVLIVTFSSYLWCRSSPHLVKIPHKLLKRLLQKPIKTTNQQTFVQHFFLPLNFPSCCNKALFGQLTSDNDCLRFTLWWVLATVCWTSVISDVFPMILQTITFLYWKSYFLISFFAILKLSEKQNFGLTVSQRHWY